jgi:O-antigen ligase
MDRLAYAFLWLSVFALPWEDLDIVALPGLDPTRSMRASSLLGLAAFGLATGSVLLSGRIRKPGRFLGASLLFLLWAAASMLWTIDRDSTVGRVTTYAQLVLLACLIWQLARSEARQSSLYQAYVLGAYVSAVSTILNYLSGTSIIPGRYVAGAGFNANDLGFTLVLAVPMAWYLSIAGERGRLFWLNRLYVPLGMAAVLLTGSRSAFLPSLVALGLVPWTMTRLRLRSKVAVVLLAGASLYFIGSFVPETSWERLSQTKSEITAGTMTHRRDIWEIGMQLSRQQPVTGFGAGTFTAAAAPYLDRPRASHNAYLSVLVEQGLVGLALFVGLLAVTMLPVRRMPALRRKYWIVMSCTLLIGLVPRNWDYRKATWFVLASLASECAMLRYAARTQFANRRLVGAVPQPGGGTSSWVPARARAHRSAEEVIQHAHR